MIEVAEGHVPIFVCCDRTKFGKIILMRYSIIFVLALMSHSVFSQSKFDGKWTDGNLSFSAFFVDNHFIQFEGGDLHEGGSMFYGELLSDSKFKLLGRTSNDQYPPSYGEENDFMEYKNVQSFELLVLKAPNGKIKGLLQKQKINLGDLVIRNKVNHQLAGEYQIVDSGKKVTFLPNQLKVEGLSVGERYKFETEYDFPIDVMTFESESLYFVKNKNTIDLYNAKLDGYDEFDKGELLLKLVLIKKLPINPTQLSGEYSFASTIPMINGILFHYSLDELRIIRNEIFARHGYQFKSKELMGYFESKSWYKPQFNDVTKNLLELEKINIQQIKYVEARKMQIKNVNE